MSCERATTEEYRVVVKVPKSLSTRCGECWTGVGRACTGFARVCTGFGRACTACCSVMFYFFLFLIFIAIIWASWWLVILLSYCQSAPGLGLEDVNIRDMVVYQNATMATTDTPWQVKSDINVNLSTWNPNTVAGCFSTYRRMVVQVQYKGQQILQQEVPLGFALKPRHSRPVLLELQGDHFPLQTELGSLLELDLRNTSAVELQFSFEVRYLRNDRKASWMGMGCDVIAKTPANVNSSLVNNSSTSGIVQSSCSGI